MEIFSLFTDTLAGRGDFTITWDVAIIAFIFVAIFFYGLNAGRKRIALFLASFYGSIALVSLFPASYVANLISLPLPAEQLSLGLIALFVVVFYFVLNGSMLVPALPFPKRGGKFLHILVMTAALSGFLVSVVGSLLEPTFGEYISTITRQIFLQPIARFAWGAIPLVALSVAARYKDQ